MSQRLRRPIASMMVQWLTVATLGWAIVVPEPATAQDLSVMDKPPIRDFLPDGGFGRAHPDAPAEVRQFGRLVGLWEAVQEVRAADGSWVVAGPAVWAWKYALGGFAVHDLWFQEEVQLPEYLGDLGRDYLLTALRVWDARAARWKIAWAANGRGETPGDDFGTAEAEWTGDRMIMRAPPNDFGLQRIIFHDITDDAFRWRSEFSTDQGETWQAIMRVRATRLR